MTFSNVKIGSANAAKRRDAIPTHDTRSHEQTVPTLEQQSQLVDSKNPKTCSASRSIDEPMKNGLCQNNGFQGQKPLRWNHESPVESQ